MACKEAKKPGGKKPRFQLYYEIKIYGSSEIQIKYKSPILGLPRAP